MNNLVEHFHALGWSIPAFRVDEISPRAHRHVLIIPVLNEGQRLQTQLQEIRLLGLAQLLDVVIVDGGSTDGSIDLPYLQSVEVSARITKTGPGALSAQLRCAYGWALAQGYDGLITIDGNGKDGVDTVPLFVAGLANGYDYIQASRFLRGGRAENTPVLRWIAIRLVHAPLISLAAGHWLTDTTQGYRAYSRRYLLDDRVRPFRPMFNKYELLAYLSIRASQIRMKVCEIPTTRIYPREGKIPTKIHGLRALVELLSVLLRAVVGYYNPPRQAGRARE